MGDGRVEQGARQLCADSVVHLEPAAVEHGLRGGCETQQPSGRAAEKRRPLPEHLHSAVVGRWVPAHSWQSAACAGMSIGRKGMVVAAKTLVLTGMDLFTDPAHVAAAKASFEKRRAGFEYRSRIPLEHKPPLNYRDK